MANFLALLTGAVVTSTLLGVGEKSWPPILYGILSVVMVYLLATKWEDTAHTGENKIQAAFWGILLTLTMLVVISVAWLNGISAGGMY